jgi:hypothetical protein
MNNDNACLICFEEDIDTILSCCNKKIHSRCVKQWWNMNNISLEDSICPHCQQHAKLETIDNIKQLPPNTRTNIIHPERVIVSNINFNLTNEEIHFINSNRNNTIPNNMFSYEINPAGDNNTNFYFNICLCLCLFIIILLIFVIIIS